MLNVLFLGNGILMERLLQVSKRFRGCQLKARFPRDFTKARYQKRPSEQHLQSKSLRRRPSRHRFCLHVQSQSLASQHNSRAPFPIESTTRQAKHSSYPSQDLLDSPHLADTAHEPRKRRSNETNVGFDESRFHGKHGFRDFNSNKIHPGPLSPH